MDASIMTAGTRSVIKTLLLKGNNTPFRVPPTTHIHTKRWAQAALRLLWPLRPVPCIWTEHTRKQTIIKQVHVGQLLREMPQRVPIRAWIDQVAPSGKAGSAETQLPKAEEPRVPGREQALFWGMARLTSDCWWTKTPGAVGSAITIRGARRSRSLQEAGRLVC